MAQVRNWVGLDVHSAMVVAACMDRESGELRMRRLPGATSDIVAFCAALPARAAAGPWRACTRRTSTRLRRGETRRSRSRAPSRPRARRAPRRPARSDDDHVVGLRAHRVLRSGWRCSDMSSGALTGAAHEPAVHHVLRTGDVVRVTGREKEGEPGDLLGLGGTLERDALHLLVAELRVVDRLLVERRPNSSIAVRNIRCTWSS